MKNIIATLLLAATALNALAAEYTLKGERHLRLYTADRATPVYNARIDAAKVVENFCKVPWTKTDVEQAQETVHTTTNLDANVKNRAAFDAALFCAKHVDSKHVAYANAACYKIDLGLGTLPNLTSLAVTVYSDPYNANGARIVLMTNDAGNIPTDCATVRGDVVGGIKATNVAKRITVTSGGKDYWYANYTNLVFSSQQLGAGGIQLHRYLYVFVLLENYGTTRGDWLEGSAYIDNEIKITTSATIPSLSKGCDIPEPMATKYHLKNGEANKDYDGDGLSNYTEYLITEVFKIATVDPDLYATSGGVCDYFKKVGDVYLGEIFTDHDGIDDEYEETHANPAKDGKPFSDRFCYDPERDADGDGWSNFEEYKAGTDPEDSASFPVPTVSARVYYCGSRREKLDRLVFRAWSEEDALSSDMTTYPDAEWVVTDADLVFDKAFTLAKPTSDKRGMGHLRGGKAKFVVFADCDGNGEYTAGEPFGFVYGVDVGWQGASFDVELTDTHPVFARISLTDGSSDRENWSETSSTIKPLAGGIGKMPDGNVRVRVVRTAVNGTLLSNMINNDVPESEKKLPLSAHAVVMDKTFNTSVRAYLHEGDFLTDSVHDIDWYTLQSDAEVYQYWNWPVNMTSVTYRIVFGDGPLTSSITNPACLKYMVDRRFDTDNHTIGVKIKPYDSVNTYNTRPIFKWAVTTEGINYNSYSAFRIQIVHPVATTNVLYDSGLNPMPDYEIRNGVHYYSWTAPSVVDNLLTANGYISRNGSYKWKVTVYNSKFNGENGEVTDNPGLGYALKSAFGTLTTLVNVTHDINDHAYSTIPVTVKYTGPSSVLGKVHNLGDLRGKVRVQAFKTANFSGEPISETLITNELSSASLTTANGKLYGLPMNGTYYLRAYIDMNGNLKKDDWESWGAAGVAVAAGTETPVGIWIEDADTDDDWLPDAWEFAQAGWRDMNNWLSKKGKDVSAEFHVTQLLKNAVRNNTLTYGLTDKMAGAPLTIFSYNSSTNAVFGVGTNTVRSASEIKQPQN